MFLTVGHLPPIRVLKVFSNMTPMLENIRKWLTSLTEKTTKKKKLTKAINVAQGYIGGQACPMPSV